MDGIKVNRTFSHCVGIDQNGAVFAPGEYEIVEANSAAQLEPGQIDARGAEVAVKEGWAEPAKGKNPRKSPGSGQGKQSSAPQADQASTKASSTPAAGGAASSS